MNYYESDTLNCQETIAWHLQRHVFSFRSEFWHLFLQTNAPMQSTLITAMAQ